MRIKNGEANDELPGLAARGVGEVGWPVQSPLQAPPRALSRALLYSPSSSSSSSSHHPLRRCRSPCALLERMLYLPLVVVVVVVAVPSLYLSFSVWRTVSHPPDSQCPSLAPSRPRSFVPSSIPPSFFPLSALQIHPSPSVPSPRPLRVHAFCYLAIGLSAR